MRVTIECPTCGEREVTVLFGWGGAIALDHICDLPKNRAVSGGKRKGPIHVSRLRRRNSNPHVWEPERAGAF